MTGTPTFTAAVEAVLALHSPLDVEPSETICAGCSTKRGHGDTVRYFPFEDYPCETVRAVREHVGVSA